MKNNFGDFLKQKRLDKKLTQKNLANLLYVTESAVNKWEKNVAHPDITLLPKLSEILGVTEHELITASIDKETRKEKVQAKKWRIVSVSWELFFLISYGIALLTCFIINLAVEGTLSWFWIVISALLLSFSFTNLPKLIKCHKLLLLPTIMFLCFCILLATCAIFTNGDWFWISILSVFLALVIVFTPIYLVKYKIFSRVRKYADFISVGIDFVVLNILLIVIDYYTISNNYVSDHWYFNIAFLITLIVYLTLNLFLCVRFLKTNKLIKTSIILFLVNFLYLFSTLITSNNIDLQNELDNINIFKTNFSSWIPDFGLENNIHCIIFLTIAVLAIAFLLSGLIKHNKRKNQNMEMKK